MTEEQIRELSIKYLNGTATPEEREILLAWYRNTDEQIEWLSDNRNELTNIYDRVLANLRHHVQTGNKRRNNSGMWLAAASIILCGFLLFILRNKINHFFL